MGVREERDVLEVASERLWREIRRLLPRYGYLDTLGASRTRDQSSELARLRDRVSRLRSRSNRYRDVLRDEAWARYLDDDPI